MRAPLRLRISSTTASMILGAAFMIACAPSADDGEDSADAVKNGADWWSEERAARNVEYSSYLLDHKADYEYFAHNAVGSSGAEFIPFVLYRLFPELGTESDGGGKFGYITEQNIGIGDLKAAPEVAPLGFVRTGVSKTTGVSYLSRSCAGCHTGRVEVNGKVVLFPGMPNTELRFHQAVGSLYTSVVKTFGQDRGAAKKEILKRLESKSVVDIFGSDADQDAANEEIEKLKGNLDALLDTMLLIANSRLMSVSDWSDIAYGGKVATESGKKSLGVIDPMPGIADSTGYSTVSGQGTAAYVGAIKTGKSASDAAQALHDKVASVITFRGTGMNDIPSMWLKGKAALFQWDGDVRGEFFRNLGAALGGMVGSSQDVLPKNLEHISNFIDTLPAPPYPFELEGSRDLWTRGKQLYDQNCAGCHQADQNHLGSYWADSAGEPLLWNLATDTNRTKVTSSAGTEGFNAAIDNVCKLSDSPADACKTPREDRLVKRDAGKYLAVPLDGLWARAPYLHNGSVPTLRHLLVPSTRPETFVRGSISYDTKNVGFAWDTKDKRAAKGVVYDTRFDGFDNGGHVGTIQLPAGGTARMTWDDANAPEVEALLEYLRTL